MASTRRVKAATLREQETRAQILAVARKLARQYGPHKLSMEDIAAACGKTKSFLYYYFPGKRELMKALVAAELSEVSRTVRDAVEAQRGAADKLRTFIKTRLEAVVKQVTSLGVATIDRFMREPYLGADFKALVEMRRAADQDDMALLVELLRLGISEGTFRAVSTPLIEDIAYFMMSSMRGVELELAFDAEHAQHRANRTTGVVEILMAGLSK